ncbi:hypothetical protein HYC85_000427 [Camellia sinensis]|uniref:Aromatic amino acid beta-eliminating lyase/threonine aldolase domain-containing protein n=1 Tax=Camellia sinensis TaxID=4442 RepID=A0A7J7I544_CAMSI|nr:hypothetical protein HYC85_000427 [Camellia sinensis]
MLTGGSLLNAAVVALGIPVHRLVQAADSVSVGLHGMSIKGLDALAGTVIVGSKDFITRAKTLRKTLGGGMRQVGVLCAAALVAVQENVGKLESDHNNAKFLAQGLNRIEGLKVDVNSVETNIADHHHHHHHHRYLQHPTTTTSNTPPLMFSVETYGGFMLLIKTGTDIHLI